jgi:hypothetical protein
MSAGLIPSALKNCITDCISIFLHDGNDVAILKTGCFQIMIADYAMWELSVANRLPSII